jgi:DNA polymerase-1
MADPADILEDTTPPKKLDETSHLYLVDGSGYIFRAYHALPPLTRKSDNLPTGAVHGFTNMLVKLLRDAKDGDKPTHLAVIFDASERTFRNELYAEYKAHRPPAPEDLVPQFPLIRRCVTAFNTPCIEQNGFEADDLIATYARAAERVGAKVTIISSDKDLMQLVSDKITLLDTMKDQRIGREQVIEKFGVPPEKVIEVQALCGDSVDNVPGVPGIGVKTAAQLINEYGDLESLLARAHEIKQPKRRENLIEYAEAARISKTLVTLRDDLDLPDTLESFYVRDPDAETLLGFIDEMEFTTIGRRIRDALGAAAEIAAVAATEPTPSVPFDRDKYECVTTREALLAWIDRARAAGVVAVDTETDALDAAGAGLCGISLAVAPNEACYIPLNHCDPDDSGDLLGSNNRPAQIDCDEALQLLKPLLADPAVLKVGQNIKYDLSVLRRYGVEVAPFDDTMLISYSLDGGLHNHGMDELSVLHLGHAPIAFKEVCGSGKTQIGFDRVALDKATCYAAEDADVTLRLWRRLKPRLAAEGVTTVYERLERPLAPVLASMERAGVKVDVGVLRELSVEFAHKMEEAEARAHALAGKPFNLGSPKQIGEILFGDMGVPGGKKTKGGAWSTDARVLEDLAAEGNEFARSLMDWRQYSKLKSTYADSLPTAINRDTGRVHTSFSLAATPTGRLSSSDPNLQNIPIRTNEGRRIRQAFIAEPGKVLVSADYSQIELRVLAHVADIPALRKAFADGLDIHAMTASEMFGVPVEGMDPMVRRRAKAINFGIIYGISAFGLAANLSIGRDEARAYIDAYFEKFPGIRAYMDETKNLARQQGYVSTLFGRRIHVPGIRDKNFNVRGFAERQAINAPIQGAAADVIRRAMIRLPAAIQAAGIEAQMLLQVHDELVFEVAESQVEDLKALAKDVMQDACAPTMCLAVPLVVEAGQGPNWAEAH